MAKKEKDNTPISTIEIGHNKSEVSQIIETPIDTDPKTQLIVCAYEGTEQTMQRIWDSMCETPSLVFGIDENTSYKDVIASCIADQDIADKFIFVPANVIPCSPILLEEMFTPQVLLDSKRGISYDLPMRIDKDLIIELVSDVNSSDREMFEAYLRTLNRAVFASHYFGNTVAVVLRSNPDLEVLKEAMKTRKFIRTSAVGFKASSHLLKELIRD